MNDPIANLLGNWSVDENIYSILFRIFLSLIIGGILGFERAWKGQAAGFRTFILISVASTFAAILDSLIGSKYLFISAASILAIAIIGANSITMTSKNRIRGLTTTVGLFLNVILCIAIGAGGYTIGLIGIIIAIVALGLLGKVESILKEKSSHMLLHLELSNSQYLENFTTTIRKLGMIISDIEVNNAYKNTSLSVYTVSIELNNKNVLMYKKHKDIIKALDSLDYIVYIEELV